MSSSSDRPIEEILFERGSQTASILRFRRKCQDALDWLLTDYFSKGDSVGVVEFLTDAKRPVMFAIAVGDDECDTIKTIFEQAKKASQP